MLSVEAIQSFKQFFFVRNNSNFVEIFKLGKKNAQPL